MTMSNATLVHFARGRIRLRSKWLKGRQHMLPAIRDSLESLTAIKQVEFNQRTGSILIIYSPHSMEDGRTIDALLVKLTSLFSPLHIGRIGVLRAGNSRVSLGFDGRIPTRLHKGICSALVKIEGISGINTDPATGRIDFNYDSAIIARHVRLLHKNLQSNNWAALLRLFL